MGRVHVWAAWSSVEKRKERKTKSADLFEFVRQQVGLQATGTALFLLSGCDCIHSNKHTNTRDPKASEMGRDLAETKSYVRSIPPTSLRSAEPTAGRTVLLPLRLGPRRDTESLTGQAGSWRSPGQESRSDNVHDRRRIQVRTVECLRGREEREEEDDGVGEDRHVATLRVEHVRLRPIQRRRSLRPGRRSMLVRRTAPVGSRSRRPRRGRCAPLPLRVAVRFAVRLGRQFALLAGGRRWRPGLPSSLDLANE